MRIGDRIKNRRIDLGLTVDEIAAALGKNRATVYRYESNAIENFPTTVLEPLADVLETTPAYLMGWTEDPYDYDKDPDNLIGTIPGDICRHLAEIYGGDADEMWKAYQSMDEDSGAEHSCAKKIRSESEERMLFLARKAEEIPEEQREKIFKNFEDTIDIYLEAKGLKKGDD